MPVILLLLFSFAAWAAPAKVQTAKAQPASTGTAVNFTLGSTSTVGSVLIACIQNSEFGANRTVSAPDGTWTNFRDLTQNNVQQTVWWKVVTSGATTYNFTVSGTNEWHSGVLWEISGADTTTPIDGSAQTGYGSPGQNTIVTPNVTPSVIGTLALACVSTDNAQVLNSVSSGWTADQSARPSYHGTYGASKDDLTADTSTAISNTFSFTSNEVHVKSTILIAPSTATSRRKVVLIQ